ncbi:MAG: cytochrome C, partial [Planctomycetota bacterium]
TYELIDFHADHWHFDTSGSWTKSRDGAANKFGGGHAHSGVMIYQGGHWPSQYDDKLFTLNFHGRRANVERLQRHGSGYVAKHEDDFLLAADPWFRGMDLTSGPDGNVFVLDWSDTGECHEHDGVHRESGRIYKVIYEGNDQKSRSVNAAPTATLTMESLRTTGEFSDEMILAAIQHPNVWYFRRALLQLAERADTEFDSSPLAQQIERIATETKDPVIGCRAINALFCASGQPFVSNGVSVSSFPKWISACSLRAAKGDQTAMALFFRLIADEMPLDDCMGPRIINQQQSDQHLKSSRFLGMLLGVPSISQGNQGPLTPASTLALASMLQRLHPAFRSQLALELV